MSEKQKSGEDLIEKVEQEVAESTEETKEEAVFDPKAFASQEGKVESKENNTEEESIETEQEEESDDCLQPGDS